MARPTRDPLFTPEDYRSRPRDFDPATAELIIDRVLNGETLLEVCLGDRDMPLPGTFLRWLEDDPTSKNAYEEALLISARVQMDEILSESWNANTFVAGNRMRALQHRVERLNPNRFSPRATIHTPPKEGDDDATVDYGAEVRRKLDAIARRLQENDGAA